MSDKTRQLGRDALKLTPAERIELVDDILDSLDKPDADLDRLWAEEARDRLEAYRRGEVRARELKDVIAKYPRP